MGQYHKVYCISRREMIHPHSFGDGVKLMEFGCSSDGTLLALTVLLAGSCKGGPRGGGDFRGTGPESARIVGRWSGHPIAIVGDYAEEGDVAGVSMAQFDAIEWVDISGPVLECLKSDPRLEVRDSWGSNNKPPRVLYEADGDTFVQDSPVEDPQTWEDPPT